MIWDYIYLNFENGIDSLSDYDWLNDYALSATAPDGQRIVIRPSREVLPAQWMFREEINVVRNDHKVANFELRIHSACSVTHEECLDAQLVHNPHRECHFFHVVALIEMETPLHGHDVLVAKLPENQFP